MTVSTNTSYQIEYQVGGTTGTWTDIANGGTIPNLSNGTTVYARLTDGVNVGEHASVTISDTTGPTVNLSTSATYNSITVTVNASDSGSGLATTDTYKYYINNESTPRNTSTSNSYTFSGLSAQTGYSIKVEVADKLNNIGTGTASVTTPKKPATNVNELTEAEFVEFRDGKNNWLITYAVLYDSNSEYGVEVIPMETLGYGIIGNGSSIYDISSSDTSAFNTAINSYNNAINYLNSATQEYINTTYVESARCVGSVPGNPNYDASAMFSHSEWSYLFPYNGTFKDDDNNYVTDYNQMTKLGIANIGEYYWMASRFVGPSSYACDIRVRLVDSER